MRRKVDEIGRKLEILSDLLRESRLSIDILQGLHYIVQGLLQLTVMMYIDCITVQ